MVDHKIEYSGRLAIFTLLLDGRAVVTASGYRIPEENGVRLYLVSLWEERLVPPRRLLHVGMARFAKALGATHLVPVDLTAQGAIGRVPKGLADGFIPCLPPVRLSELETRLEHLVARESSG